MQHVPTSISLKLPSKTAFCLIFVAQENTCSSRGARPSGQPLSDTLPSPISSRRWPSTIPPRHAMRSWQRSLLPLHNIPVKAGFVLHPRRPKKEPVSECTRLDSLLHITKHRRCSSSVL